MLFGRGKLLLLTVSLLVSVNLQSQTVINKSCGLLSKLNDTVIVDGFYWQCVEYDSFTTIGVDTCHNDFIMTLSFQNADDYTTVTRGMACNKKRRLVLFGIPLKETLVSHGHLGTTNTEFHVLEVKTIYDTTDK